MTKLPNAPTNFCRKAYVQVVRVVIEYGRFVTIPRVPTSDHGLRLTDYEL